MRDYTRVVLKQKIILGQLVEMLDEGKTFAQRQIFVYLDGVQFGQSQHTRRDADVVFDEAEAFVQRRRDSGFTKNAKTLLLLVSLAFALVGPARAWDTRLNPDKQPSIGWAVHGGRLAGFSDDNARYTEFGADVRVPITNYVTMQVDLAQTTVSNAPTGVSTDSNRIGAGMRVYLADIFKE